MRVVDYLYMVAGGCVGMVLALAVNYAAHKPRTTGCVKSPPETSELTDLRFVPKTRGDGDMWLCGALGNERRCYVMPNCY